MSNEPLSHITVVDFSRYRAGPWCTQILSELGAEIIKIEMPGSGDPARGSFPEQNGMGVDFISRNRNKKSIAVNLKSSEGCGVAEDLIAEADVVVENYSLGVMEKFGLGYDYLSDDINPEIIYASIKGYGEKGPYKNKKGVDLVMQAEGGIMSVTGPEDGQRVKLGQAMGDIGAGLYAAISVLTAINHRQRTGEGQKIETNLFGTIVSFMEEYLTMYGITGEDPTPFGTRHQTGVPYELFDTKDGQMVLSVPGDRNWEVFVTEILEDEDLLQYDSQRLRQQNYERIMEVIRPKLRERTTEEWTEIFDGLGFPNGPLNNVSDVIEHPQAQSRDYVVEYEDQNIGNVTLHGHPIHFSTLETTIRTGPPQLGEHTDDILMKHLNLSSEEVDSLRERDAIA